jgi:4-hydroxy-2-oxoglutarate aldolase
MQGVGEVALRLSGVFPPILTPFDARGAVDARALVANLQHWNSFGLRGYVVLGTNGEAALLDLEERAHILEVARGGIPDDRLLIAGTGCQSTRATIELTARASRLGADAALVLPPSYYRAQMTRDVLRSHYHAVADSSGIPVLIYNMPACTGIDLDIEAIAAIAAHENIVGIKDSGGDVAKLGAIRERLGEAFTVLAGSGGFFLPALSVGAAGGVLALANIAPRECLEIQERFLAGDWVGASELQLRMIPLNSAVTNRWGVPGLKKAMDLLGLYGGPVRPPLVKLAAAHVAELRRTLEKAGLAEWPREEGGHHERA